MTIHFRSAHAGDADRIADLHADSWRRHYRGAYTDAYLDGDLLADRRAVWATRLAAPAGTSTIVAERGGLLAGFVHVVPERSSAGLAVDELAGTGGSGLGRSRAVALGGPAARR